MGKFSQIFVVRGLFRLATSWFRRLSLSFSESPRKTVSKNAAGSFWDALSWFRRLSLSFSESPRKTVVKSASESAAGGNHGRANFQGSGFGGACQEKVCCQESGTWRPFTCLYPLPKIWPKFAPSRVGGITLLPVSHFFLCRIIIF